MAQFYTGYERPARGGYASTFPLEHGWSEALALQEDGQERRLHNKTLEIHSRIANAASVRSDRKIIVTFIVLTVIVGAIYFASRRSTTTQPPTGARTTGRVGTPDFYPAPQLTPGRQEDANVEDLLKRWPCPSRSKAGADGLCTYSAAHRNVSAAEKRQIYDEYEALHPGITEFCKAVPNGPHQRCEVDHFIPECAGGANDPSNLWIQRADSTLNGEPMGFHQKDVLEEWGCQQIKARRLDPAEFARRVTEDWVAYYREIHPSR